MAGHLADVPPSTPQAHLRSNGLKRQTLGLDLDCCVGILDMDVHDQTGVALGQDRRSLTGNT